MSRWIVYSRTKDKLITDEWGRFLGRWPWEFFATLTFRPCIKVKGRFIERNLTFLSAKRLVERYLQENDKYGSLEYFLAVESDGFTIPHVHLLVCGVGKLAKWPHGIIDIQPYNPLSGARYYVVKHITSKHIEYGFNLHKREELEKMNMDAPTEVTVEVTPEIYIDMELGLTNQDLQDLISKFPDRKVRRVYEHRFQGVKANS